MLQRSALAAERRELRHLRIEVAAELIAQLAKIVRAPQRVVQPQELKISRWRCLAVGCNVLLEHLNGLIVLPYRNKEFGMLLKVKKGFGVDDMREAISTWPGFCHR